MSNPNYRIVNTGAGGGGGGETFNETLTECPVCDRIVREEYLPLHIRANHPLPREPWWLRALRWLVAAQTIACSGPPFTLADPLPIEESPDAQATSNTAPTPGISNVRELPDASDIGRDSGGVRGLAENDASPVDTDARAQGPEANSAAPIADAGTQETQAQPSSLEASIQEACSPPPVTGGYSNICATNPARGSSIIQTFPGECACNWTCACLMTSSVCQGLGAPASCQVVNGATCNSVVVAVVVCK